MGGGVGDRVNYYVLVNKLVVLKKTRSLATQFISKFTHACITRVTEPTEEFKLSEMCG